MLLDNLKLKNPFFLTSSAWQFAEIKAFSTGLLLMLSMTCPEIVKHFSSFLLLVILLKSSFATFFEVSSLGFSNSFEKLRGLYSNAIDGSSLSKI